MAYALDHVEHVATLAQCDDVCVLGSDLDGGFGPASAPEGLRGPEHFDTLTDALTLRGWSASACAKFAHKNWLRVWNAALAERR